MEVDYSKLPGHICYGMFRWIEFGNVPGQWMCYLLTNDLVHTWGFADATNRERMGDIISFIYNEAPGPCWGSQEKIDAWAEQGGARGDNLPLKHLNIPAGFFEPEGERE